MKTQISKNTKRALSFVLAFALVLGSVFVANSGVTLKADAESTAATELTWDGTYTQPTTTDGDTVVINTASELAWVALKGGAETSDKTYKIADGIKSIYINDVKGLTLTQVENKLESKNTNAWVYQDAMFQGTFDGNGVTVYGLYSEGTYSSLGGLFPKITGNVSVKNLKISTSYVGGVVVIGAIIGNVASNTTDISFENCSVENCYLYTTQETSHAWNNGAAALCGGGETPTASFVVNKCAVYNNEYYSACGEPCNAIASQIGNPTKYSISNTLVLGISPLGGNAGAYAVRVDGNYSNVYTDQTLSTTAAWGDTAFTNIKTIAVSNITGIAAKTNLDGFDFDTTWWAVKDSTPELRVFHNLVTTYVDETYHSEACDCGLVSADNSKHVYVDDDVNKTSLCACGAQGVYADIWDGTAADSYKSGTGTETDPYIIDTPEQLYKMVRSNGVDESGNALYFKVANNVKSLYLNDTRNKTASEFATAAASGSLNNWSAGLKTDSDVCNIANCTGLHRNACAEYFSGYFDGNGVTIYGLYSQTDLGYWASGVGFVPALQDNAVIENVIFDTCYVKNSGGYIGVITSGNGYWAAQYSDNMCADLQANLKAPSTSKATIANVVVRNANIVTTQSPLDKKVYASAFVASCLEPASINIINCLYDGENGSFSYTEGSILACGAMYSSPQGYSSAAKINNCLAINSDWDIATAQRWSGVTSDFVTISYSDGITSNNTTLGSLAAPNSYHDSDGLFDITAFPLINWTAWNVDTDTLTAYGTPMPKVNDGWQTYNNNYYQDTINNSQKYKYDTDDFIPVGGYGDIQYDNGDYKKWFTLEGSGTATDPYIINDEITLYQIIATGGADHGVPQYFKLGCDLDLHGSQWCTNTTVTNAANTNTYKYSAFVGTIDGDGHTISGLYSASADFSAEPQLAFIPVMAGGTVKNIRFANSYVYSAGSKAVIATGTGTIEGCSVIDAVGTTDIASSGITVKNSYAGTTYYGPDGTTTTVTADFTGNNVSNAIWYAGSTGKALLLSQALKMPCADVDGDGLGYEYTANDLVALKQRLLRTSGYEHVYGDVSRNGKINATDLVILKKELSNSLELDKLDGFWANIKAGKFTIYYNGTDNYDFARKLELYFEQVAGVTVPKTISAAPTGQDYAIILKIDSSLGENNYSVAYDIENAVLTFTGGSFTAVEQTVLDFVANSDANLGKVYTVDSGTLSTEKQAITVSDTNYYYAWGDEFTTGDTYTVDGTTKTTVDYSKWSTRDKYNDDETSSEGKYMQNQRSATHKNYEAEQLNVVENGKLTLKRGYSTTESKFYQSGVYSLYSMLFKFGYVEAKCTVPVDGYSFTSLWLNGGAGHHNAQIDNSLYSKVYEFNSAYNGKINYDASDLDTYKYKLPNTYWEFDIFETIQKPKGKTSGVLSWKTECAAASEQSNLFFNAHKWVKNVKDSDGTYYNIDWDNYTQTAVSTITDEYYTTNKVNSNYKIDYENNKSYSDTINDYQTCLQYYNSAQISGKSYVEMIYGFEWKEDVVHYYAWSVNSDGSKGDMLYHKYIYFTAFSNAGEILDTTDNGYMYVLMENNMYSSSEEGYKITTYTDAMTDMTFDYVRVYQTADNRDIVTGETEAFNNNDRWTADVYK